MSIREYRGWATDGVVVEATCDRMDMDTGGECEGVCCGVQLQADVPSVGGRGTAQRGQLEAKEAQTEDGVQGVQHAHAHWWQQLGSGGRWAAGGGGRGEDGR